MSSTNQINNLSQPKYNATGGKNNWESVDSGGVFMDVLTVEIKNSTAPKEPTKSSADTSVQDTGDKAQANASDQQRAAESEAENIQAEQKSDSAQEAQAEEKAENSAVENEKPEPTVSEPEIEDVVEDIEPDQSVLLQVQTMVAGYQGDTTTENTVIETETDIVPELTDSKSQASSDKVFVSSTDSEMGRTTAKQQAATTDEQLQKTETAGSQQNSKVEKPVSDNLLQVVEGDSEETASIVTAQQSEEETEFVANANRKITESQQATGQSIVEKDSKPLSDIARPIEKESDTKRDNLKDFEQDYRKVAVSTQQQNDTGADTSGREHGRHKGFNYSDDISSTSGSAGSGNTSRDINELLGTQAKADDMKIDSARTVDNVVKSVKTLVQNGNPSMTLRLDPPELGQLNIKISSDPNGMTIEIQATSAKAQQMLQQNSNQLRSALENAGVNVNNVDVQFKPDVKNNANAGSDSQDNQQGLFDQNNSSFKGDSREQHDEFLHNKQDFWSDSSSFEESQYEQDINRELSAATVNNWQELAFDTVDVTV